MNHTIESMKEQIKLYTKQLSRDFKEIEEPWETVTLWHGTTTKYLNEILKNGILPRRFHDHQNFEEHPSNEELVYLTTKWHYWYAYNANQESLMKEVGEERFEKEDIETLWNETGDFPMYIICNVPKELLTLDEDVVYQYGTKRRMRSGEIQHPSDITIDECLNQGTVASLKPIDPLYINEIIILGSAEYKKELMEGSYRQESHNWFNGLGMGDMTADELAMHEIITYRKKIHIMEYKYPAKENPTVTSIQVIDGELEVQTK